jgi:hypothetical protein
LRLADGFFLAVDYQSYLASLDYPDYVGRMSDEDKIELRDRMILNLVQVIDKDPEVQRRLIRVAEAQATEEMEQPIFLAVNNERQVS